MGKLFGTDGVRGVANVYPMTAEITMQIGRAVAHYCKNHKYRHRIVIGKDTRLSGYMIENALVAGICSMGVDALLVGPMPTPAISFITTDLKADAGIVIPPATTRSRIMALRSSTAMGINYRIMWRTRSKK